VGATLLILIFIGMLHSGEDTEQKPAGESA